MRSFNSARLFGLLGLLVILCLVFAGASGQQRRGQGKVPKTAPVTVKKPSTESSCDGALDIVPSQPSTFARKRRPARVATPPAVNVPEKKADGNASDDPNRF
jgi:hypothetical protein